MPAPRPGSPVRGSTTGRPIMAAMDLLGRRWALRIIWELRTGPVGARALLARCQGLSSSVLYQRLAELTTSSLITATTNGYQLTPLGASLGRALAPLDAWASTWAQTQTPTDQANQALPLQSAGDCGLRNDLICLPQPRSPSIQKPCRTAGPHARAAKADSVA